MILGMCVGAMAGIGIVVVWSLWWPEDATRSLPTQFRPRWVRGCDERLSGIGLVRARFEHLVVLSVVSSAVMFILCFALTHALIPSVVALVAAAGIPFWVLNALSAKRRATLQSAWPEVIDLVNSAVKAGLTLPEALSQLAERGPQELRPAFSEFAKDYRATGDFGHSLDRLKLVLSDPVGDRIVEALRVAREVGGTDLGTLLRTLSSFLREDARVRSELEARQSWTINGAKLALAAPWIVLLLMLMRPEAADAYDSAGGAVLIIGGAIISVVAYRIMLAFAKLPQDERVLR